MLPTKPHTTLKVFSNIIIEISSRKIVVEKTIAVAMLIM